MRPGSVVGAVFRCGKPRKKTAEAIQQEAASEVEQLLRSIFTGVRKTGHIDLESVEMLVHSAMHQAGASALAELLRFSAADQRAIQYPCGQQRTIANRARRPC
jgi:hypothetical protein